MRRSRRRRVVGPSNRRIVRARGKGNGAAVFTGASAQVLVQSFTREVAAAVEASIAQRTRALVEKAASPSLPAGANGVAALTEERWPTLSEHQWAYIRRVLARTGGNKSEAAQILGLHRRSLQRLLASARGRAGKKRGTDASRAGGQPIVTGDGTIVLEQLTFAEIERAIVMWTLRRHAGDADRAARALGLGSRAFVEKMGRSARARR